MKGLQNNEVERALQNFPAWRRHEPLLLTNNRNIRSLLLNVNRTPFFRERAKSAKFAGGNQARDRFPRPLHRLVRKAFPQAGRGRGHERSALAAATGLRLVVIHNPSDECGRRDSPRWNRDAKQKAPVPRGFYL